MTFVKAALLCLIVSSAQGQSKDCKRPPMSSRQLNRWIDQARTSEQLLQVACYLRQESTRLEGLAAQQDASLKDAYEHNVGGSKYPSAADHARTWQAIYKEDALKDSNLAQRLEARAAHDATAH